MRKVFLIVLIATMASGPVIAQSSTGQGAGSGVRHARSTGTPIDHGPFTPEANRAFQGGGMVLEGAPGAPAPRPEPTPPGQTPRNMVPPGS